MLKTNDSNPTEQTHEQKDFQLRVQLFDKEFRAIQDKYKLRVVSQVMFPGGAVLSVPIQVSPFNPVPTSTNPSNDKASNPSE